MGPLTSVTPAVATAPRLAVTGPVTGAVSSGSPKPVAAPDHQQAPRQPEAKSAADRHLSQPPPSDAEAAAASARRAYIEASIAAGVNPLPLPGR